VPLRGFLPDPPDTQPLIRYPKPSRALSTLPQADRPADAPGHSTCRTQPFSLETGATPLRLLTFLTFLALWVPRGAGLWIPLRDRPTSPRTASPLCPPSSSLPELTKKTISVTARSDSRRISWQAPRHRNDAASRGVCLPLRVYVTTVAVAPVGLTRTLFAVYRCPLNTEVPGLARL
jgi:hypothetical protein